MNRQEFSDEVEAHLILARVKRSRVLSVYFSLKENNIPSHIDPVDAVLYLIPVRYYETFLSMAMPYDPLMKRILDLSV